MGIDWSNPDTKWRLDEVMSWCKVEEAEARRALEATGDRTADAAIEWVDAMKVRTALEAAGQALVAPSRNPEADRRYEEARAAYAEERLGETFDLYVKAARLGHVAAIGAVGSALYYGAGVKQDRAGAKAWLSLARRHGHEVTPLMAESYVPGEKEIGDLICKAAFAAHGAEPERTGKAGWRSGAIEFTVLPARKGASDGVKWTLRIVEPKPPSFAMGVAQLFLPNSAAIREEGERVTTLFNSRAFRVWD